MIDTPTKNQRHNLDVVELIRSWSNAVNPDLNTTLSSGSKKANVTLSSQTTVNNADAGTGANSKVNIEASQSAGNGISSQLETERSNVAPLHGDKNFRQQADIDPDSVAGNNSGADDSDFMQALSTVIAYVAEAIFVVNDEGIIEMVNPLAAKIFGDAQQALIGQSWCAFLAEGYRDDYLAKYIGWKNSRGKTFYYGPQEVVIDSAGDQQVDVDLTLSCIPQTRTGARPLFIGVMHDLSHHKSAYQKLQLQACTDALTGLANRHAFDDVLQRCWTQTTGDLQSMSLVMIDVDYFKLFNDRFGHINGDRCLKLIAEQLKAVLPNEQCIAARYGGEEFALILPGCNQLVAELTAKKVQHAINNLAFTELGLHPSVRVSVSQGIAVEKMGEYPSAIALLCAADTALYRAKSDGRNRINTSA
ncbi:GGDEF domain-containing protein [Shewanella waksmanii]|uniref:GGDEF domain-containing protein n=1 Tax=Shewanella waksmanii TaxID=213783 RepID=UPI0004BA1BFE|nr:sensor domain-containing diguanylate cyclase [Shewanella waksmanii]